MLESMTGFGKGEVTAHGIRVVAEMRSVNNRYLELSFRLPQSVKNRENDLKKIIQAALARGKVNIHVQLDYLDEDYLDVKVDPTLVKSYTRLLAELRESAGLKEDVKLDHLLQFREIFAGREISEEEEGRILDVVKKAIGQAAADIKKSRIEEGESLRGDLEMRIDRIEEACGTIEKLAEDRIPEAREKMTERINALLDGEEADRERLEQEIAMLADKLDISEELVRMNSHIRFFRETMNGKASNGRKLNFILQEMHREVNTMGVKANHADISMHVVNMKENLENIREQVQNIA